MASDSQLSYGGRAPFMYGNPPLGYNGKDDALDTYAKALLAIIGSPEGVARAVQQVRYGGYKGPTLHDLTVLQATLDQERKAWSNERQELVGAATDATDVLEKHVRMCSPDCTCEDCPQCGKDPHECKPPCASTCQCSYCDHCEARWAIDRVEKFQQ